MIFRTTNRGPKIGMPGLELDFGTTYFCSCGVGGFQDMELANNDKESPYTTVNPPSWRTKTDHGLTWPQFRQVFTADTISRYSSLPYWPKFILTRFTITRKLQLGLVACIFRNMHRVGYWDRIRFHSVVHVRFSA